MKNKLVAIILIIIIIIIGFVLFKMYKSNKKVESYQFSEDELEIVETFKEIKLQPTIGNPYSIVKWRTSISIFVKNLDSADYVPKYVLSTIENLNKIIQKSNFSIKLTNNKLDSNVILYIGKRDDVEKKLRHCSMMLKMISLVILKWKFMIETIQFLEEKFLLNQTQLMKNNFPHF